MAWTAARTWVDNELVTAALLNEQIRDQFVAVGTHDHSAAPGATVLTPSRVDLAQQATPVTQDSPGRFQRTASGLWYTLGVNQNAFIGEGAAANVPATRSLGALATQGSKGTHRHTVNQAPFDSSDAGVDDWPFFSMSASNVGGTFFNRTFARTSVGEREFLVPIVRIPPFASAVRFKMTIGGAVVLNLRGNQQRVYTPSPVEIPQSGLAVTMRFEFSNTGADLTWGTLAQWNIPRYAFVRVYIGAGLD